MKLLFDQNISYRILKKIEADYPNAQQVRRLGLDNTSDIEIWEYAKKHEFSIVTFDGDFADIATINGHPPKILWLRTGNTTTDNIAKILIEKKEMIKAFLEEEEYQEIACLEID
jgi:predicted nuclease of predicted toxin-antitoxin system